VGDPAVAIQCHLIGLSDYASIPRLDWLCQLRRVPIFLRILPIATTQKTGFTIAAKRNITKKAELSGARSKISVLIVRSGKPTMSTGMKRATLRVIRLPSLEDPDMAYPIAAAVIASIAKYKRSGWPLCFIALSPNHFLPLQNVSVQWPSDSEVQLKPLVLHSFHA
jgi:hypothetical protein